MNTPLQSSEGRPATPSGVAGLFVSSPEAEAERTVRAGLLLAREHMARALDCAKAAGYGGQAVRDLAETLQRLHWHLQELA